MNTVQSFTAPQAETEAIEAPKALLMAVEAPTAADAVEEAADAPEAPAAEDAPAASAPTASDPDEYESAVMRAQAVVVEAKREAAKSVESTKDAVGRCERGLADAERAPPPLAEASSPASGGSRFAGRRG